MTTQPDSTDDQATRYRARRNANTMADGRRPYAWWKQFQRALSIPEVTQADIERDAARMAKMQTEVTDDRN